MHDLLLLEMSRIVPDIEQHNFEECYSSDPKVAINPLTELDILYTNADQLVNKMDDLSILIAGDEPDLILISEVLPKCCVNSLSIVRLALYGYQSIYTFDPDSDQTPQTCTVLGFTPPINYQLLKLPLMDALTMNMFRFQLS